MPEVEIKRDLQDLKSKSVRLTTWLVILWLMGVVWLVVFSNIRPFESNVTNFSVGLGGSVIFTTIALTMFIKTRKEYLRVKMELEKEPQQTH